MRHRVSLAALAAVSILLGPGAVPGFSQTPRARPHAANPGQILYIAGGRLWMRSVDSGPARAVSTPWSMRPTGGYASDVQWSPDGRRVAFDSNSAKLGVTNLVNGHVTVLIGNGCPRNCSPPVFAWSPDSRYLALIRNPRGGQRGVVQVWDSATGRIRTLLRNASGYVAAPEWSHDGTRLAVPVGRFDVIKGIFPTMVVVDMQGHRTYLGKGTQASWSPDDRLIGIISPNTCGANTCNEDVLVARSTGGGRVLLRRHSSSLFDDPIWAPGMRPYVFDRWQLNAAGHPVRRLAGPHEVVLGWNPDGSTMALQTYYPYQGAPDVLYLSTRSGARTRLYRDGWNAGCGACSKDIYTVIWGTTNLYAFTTPTYPTPKDVTVAARVYVATGQGGLRRVPVPSSKNLVAVLGFADGDRTLVVHVNRAIYAYDTVTHAVKTLVRGVSDEYATATLRLESANQ